MKKEWIKRKGIIKVNNKLLEDYQINKLFYSNFFPVRIEYDFNEMCTIYCRSLYFDIVTEIEQVPEYIVTMTRVQNKLKISNVTRV